MNTAKKYKVKMFDGNYRITRITNEQKPEQAEFDTIKEAVKCCKNFWETLSADEETKEKFLTDPKAYFGVFKNDNEKAITVFNMLEEARKDKKNR